MTTKRVLVLLNLTGLTTACLLLLYVFTHGPNVMGYYELIYKKLTAPQDVIGFTNALPEAAEMMKLIHEVSYKFLGIILIGLMVIVGICSTNLLLIRKLGKTGKGDVA